MSTETPAKADADTFDVLCPADGRVVATLKNYTADEVGAIAQELRVAQPAWEALGFKGRAVWLGRWRDWVLDNQDKLLKILQDEAGKSYGDANIEILATVETINYYVKNGERFLAEQHPSTSGIANATKQLTVTPRPYQLTGNVSPWNFPLAMPMMDIPQALLAGAAVLSKPSEVTPLAIAECIRGWHEDVGGPNVIACVTGLGATGAAVVDTVDMIQFTGSTATGRKIGARAGERLIPCSLELGGKDPMIVLNDADVERATNGALWGGFFNAGQTCTSIERVYVEAGIYDEFVSVLTEKVGKLRQGMDKPGSFKADFGALANEKQRDLVHGHVEDARKNGARVVTGGAPGEHCNYPATLLLDVTNDMRCMQEETFGPTLPVMKVADAEEAIEKANDTEYGLSASVWTADRDRARAIAARLQAGAVNHNDAMMNVFQFPAPHGGWKTSGVGSRFGGAGGILKYTHPQVFVTSRISPKTEVHWYPHSKATGKLARRMTSLIAARDWRRRLGLKPKK